MESIIIRPVGKKDDAAIATVIRACLTEYEAPVCGSALGDPELDFMTEAYSAPRSAYFIAEENGKVLGGAGIAPLEHGEADVCELRKMYLASDARGTGIGRALMQACLDEARRSGFRYCYLETFPTMTAAQRLYVKSGFEYLQERKGGTGHSACEVWMQKTLGHAD